VKKNAASLSYSQMDCSQSACQCLQPWLLLGFSQSIASRTLSGILLICGMHLKLFI
jgi:hypothetical protein